MKQAVAYYRVSTKKQGASGLGLEAQRASVESYADAKGLAIAAEYTEIETGTRKRQRVEIYKAIDDSSRLGAVLLVAKFDRLARNVAFISALMDSGVRFVAVDMPEANELTIHIMAAIAQHEAKVISRRIKDALAAKRARGESLGNPANLTEAGRALGPKARQAAAKEAYRGLFNYIEMMRDKGLSYDHIAKRLTEEGHLTRQGRPFKAMTVYRIVKRGNGNGNWLSKAL